MTTFDQCLAATIGHEGDQLDRNPADAGNWTGGRCGAGELRGSRFGISAASYPQLDIAGLTRDAAAALYARDFWQPLHCDELPAPLALLAFDGGVNAGVARAARWLQAAAGAEQDGAIGPRTLAALAQAERAHGGGALCIELLARRIYYQGGLPTWRTFGLGWSRRLATLPYESVTLIEGA